MNGLPSAVGLAAKLKPEIRLAQAISEFNASLNDQKQRTRFKNLQSQSPPGPHEIIRFTEEINRDGARAHRSWRPYGTRLVAMLERIRQFAPIGDVLVGGSQNLIACGVWAVVRLSLETSLSLLSYFEAVTSMMMRLGRSLSLHKDFAMLFPACSTLQSYMCEYTIIVVNICAKVVHDGARSALSQLAASFMSTFDTAFKPLESDLATWAHLIEKRTMVLLAKANLQSQSSVMERFNRLQVTMSRESTTREKKARKHKLFTALCPDQGEFDLIWRRERKRGTSSWMYEQNAYKNWLSSRDLSVLWLKGNLGSGKTVTMASAAAHLTSTAPAMEPQGAVTVSYFFCQSTNLKSLRATTLLGSIVGQVLQSPALEASLMFFLEKPDKIPNGCARLEDYIDILLGATPSTWRGIFVLDGLDEMPREETEDIFGQFKRLSNRRRVHLLCSSRPTSTCFSIAESNLEVKWALSLETADRSDEIRAYIAAEVLRWNRIRPLPTTLQRLVEEQLLAGCQGMFLWLSLQIEDICPRYTQELRSDAEILALIGNLPKDLPEAFDRALSRATNDKHGSKLFQLVASAEPPLNMDELRVAFNVEPGNTRWDSSTLIGSGRALISSYGGSLLDIDEEDLHVRFIHYSALLHLTSPRTDYKTTVFHFDLTMAEWTLGGVCVTYLNYGVLESRISKAQKASFGQVPQITAGSVIRSEASRKAFGLLLKHGRRRDTKVDLERLSHELQEERWRVLDDVHLFLDYARDQWLLATRDTLSVDQHGLLQLWRNLMTSPIVSASLPWSSVSEGVVWALRNGHSTLFQYFLHSDDQDHLQAALSAAGDALSAEMSAIRVRGKSLGWLGPLYLAHPHCQASILQRFVELGCLPFNPTTVESPSPSLTGPALVKSAELHLVEALASYSKSPLTDSYIIFLAKYLENPNLVLDDKSTILHRAIDRRCVPLAFDLLSNGANTNGGHASGHASPLQKALQNGLTDLAWCLIELGADIAANPGKGASLLFLAVEASIPEPFTSKQARASHKKPPLRGEDACHYLRKMRFEPGVVSAEEVLEALIQHGMDKNPRNEIGETPLLLAVRTKRLHSAEILLDYGADPNIGDHFGVRPLHLAQETALIQRLLRHGAKTNVATVDGHVTPLIVATCQGRQEAVGILLSNGADPDSCLNTKVSRDEMALLGVRPEPRATAFDLCSQRLERDLIDLGRSVYNDVNHSMLAQSCSEQVLILVEFLRHWVGRNR